MVENTCSTRTLNNTLESTDGLMAGETARGTAAIAFANELANGDLMKEHHYRANFSAARFDTESYLVQKNFVVGDLGVAYALSFVTLWEVANQKVLSEQAALNIARQLTQHYHHQQQKSQIVSIVTSTTRCCL